MYAFILNYSNEELLKTANDSPSTTLGNTYAKVCVANDT